jgi:crossover junction endodeoxyribonuclease RuvC
MNVIGIDPGMEGALAVLDGRRANGTSEIIALYDLPTIGEGKQRRVDAVSLANLIRAHTPVAFAVVEQVASRPGQGVSSTFKFGMSYGVIVGIIGTLEIPIRHASPSKWKKALGLNGEAEASRARAIETWPAHADLFARKKDHNRAEAALIGLSAMKGENS